MTSSLTRKIHARLVTRTQKRLNKKKFRCLHPDCKQNAIRSHSQQKERQLRAIEKDGYVYALHPNYMSSISRENPDDPQQIVKRGIDQASTFLGFCSIHDNDLFSEVDNKELVPDSQPQALSLFIRAVSYEFSRKRNNAVFFQLLQREQYSQALPIYDSYTLDYVHRGHQNWCDFEGHYYLTSLIQKHQLKQHDSIQVLWKVIPKNIGVSCCACFNISPEKYISPVKDIDLVHDKSFSPMPLIGLNIIPTKNDSHLILTWLPEIHLDALRYIGQTDDKQSLEILINKLAFLESEDTCISPELWENASKEQQQEIALAFRPPAYRDRLTKTPQFISL